MGFPFSRFFGGGASLIWKENLKMFVWMTRCLLLVRFICEAGNDCGEILRGSQLGLDIQFPLNIRLPLLWHCAIAAQRDLRMWTHSQPFPCMHVLTVVITMKNCNHGDDDSHSNASGKEVQLSKTAEFFLTPRLLRLIAEEKAAVKRPMVTVDRRKSCKGRIFSHKT